MVFEGSVLVCMGHMESKRVITFRLAVSFLLVCRQQLCPGHNIYSAGDKGCLALESPDASDLQEGTAAWLWHQYT